MPEIPHLFSPFSIGNRTLPNRIAVSPMCQYSSSDGFATDWHLVHLGSRAVGGAGLIIVEATAVSPEGRITPSDLGIWKDEHIAKLKQIVEFVHSQGAYIGIQLAHAGRKASMAVPWEPERVIAPAEGGWTDVLAPSPIPFSDKYAKPVALDKGGIRRVVDNFGAAVARAMQAGFDAVEIHGAHGYLLHEFLSPLSNRREDEYGGSFENRIRLLLEVVDTVRRGLSEGAPLLVRISATDWVEGGWDIEQSVALAKVLKTRQVDLMDISSGALVPNAKIPAGPGFQTPFAERIRREARMPTGAVGMITGPAQADQIIRSGQADIVLIAREFLRDPYWPLQAAAEVHQPISWPRQYLRAAATGTTARDGIVDD
ncbi:MAG: NADH:flavin oxidoreductase/NADH oxidase [Acidobacteriota bacterium]|nr:NADH:flavin oxidoreductase/NADH oxidase [Acidobacteriota bacterium]